MVANTRLGTAGSGGSAGIAGAAAQPFRLSLNQTDLSSAPGANSACSVQVVPLVVVSTSAEPVVTGLEPHDDTVGRIHELPRVQALTRYLTLLQPVHAAV